MKNLTSEHPISAVKSFIIITNLPIDDLRIICEKLIQKKLKFQQKILRSLFTQVFDAILIAMFVFTEPVRLFEKKKSSRLFMQLIYHYHASTICLMTAVTLWTGSPIISRPMFWPTLRKFCVFLQSSFSVVHDRAWRPATYDKSSFHRKVGIREAGA